jgi:1,4-alpha-glucan branching enzyme
MDRRPMVIAPYDAELFGHWWFEGPMWIDFLMRKIAYDQKTVKTITPSEYLTEYSLNQVSMPSPSSWGYKGYSEVWLEGGNDWIYRHLHKAGQKMSELIGKFSTYVTNGRYKKTTIRRALNQIARELLLAQSSDWAFIMKTGTMVPYAHKRFKLHINRFTRLYEDLLNDSIDDEWLKEVEYRDNIFKNMDCASYYLSKSFPDAKASKSNKINPVRKLGRGIRPSPSLKEVCFTP